MFMSGLDQMANSGLSRHYHHNPMCKFSFKSNSHVLAQFKESKNQTFNEEMTVPETCSILSTQILPLAFAEFL